MAQRIGAGDRFRVPGLRGWLTGDQLRATTTVDLRALDWDAPPDEMDEERERLAELAQANPRRSVLLDRLRADEAVTIEWAMFYRRVGRAIVSAPPQFSSPASAPFLRVMPGDVVVPDNGPADQCQW